MSEVYLNENPLMECNVAVRLVRANKGLLACGELSKSLRFLRPDGVRDWFHRKVGNVVVIANAIILSSGCWSRTLTPNA